MRPILTQDKVNLEAANIIAKFHLDTVQEIETAIKNHDWVIVGMAHNPVVKSAKNYLTEKKITFHYIGHGNYFSQWKKRLAIKLWSGWPTFPQVFHQGKLIGGFSDLKNYLK